MALCAGLILVSGIFVEGQLFCAETELEVYETIANGKIIDAGDAVYDVAGTRKDMLTGNSANILYSYRYVGMDSTSLKIHAKGSKNVTGVYREELENVILQLPLNQQRQALLKVDPISLNPKLTKKLILTVIDDFGRVKVEVFKGELTK